MSFHVLIALGIYWIIAGLAYWEAFPEKEDTYLSFILTIVFGGILVPITLLAKAIR